MSSPSRLLATAGLIAVVVAGYIVTQVLLANPHSRTSVQAAGRQLASADRTKTKSVVAGNSPTNEEARAPGGPVVAAATYLRLLDGSGPVAGRTNALRAVTIAPFTQRVTRVASEIAALRSRLSKGGPTVIEGWRLGWRLTALTLDRARVQIWSMGIVAAPTAGVSPEWSTTTCTLVWSEASWKVSDARTTAGPTPPSPDASGPQVMAFARAASRFEAFGDAA